MNGKVKDYNIENGKVRQCDKCGMLDILDTNRFTLKQMERIGVHGHSKRCDGNFVWRKAKDVESEGSAKQKREE
jgi:hypothetical protein